MMVVNKNLGDTKNPSEEQIYSLPSEWSSIDYALLNKQNCPFGLSQIRQAQSYSMNPKVLQESIYHFALALEKDWQPKGGFQLNFFMQCLKEKCFFEYEGYYREKRVQKEREQAWLEHCRKEQIEAENQTLNIENESNIV